MTRKPAAAAGRQEPDGLAEGLRHVLGLPEVRVWEGTADAGPLGELARSLSPADVAVLVFGAGESLSSALGAVRTAGMEVAWSGLVRNAPEDIRRETPLVVVGEERAGDVSALLATGPANLLFDRGASRESRVDRPARICVASYEVVGPTKNGGIGTAATSLAELLGSAGHDVTLLYTGFHPLDDVTNSRWTQHYEQRKVSFIDVSEGELLDVDTPHFNQARAYEAYRWLAARDRQSPWDVVHFPECQGHGYYALLARRLGLAFGATTFVVGGHSPTRWVYEANRWTFKTAHRLIDDFLERRCVELADVVVSPSAYLLAWMEQHGWKLPERRFVQQYATSGAVARGSDGDADGATYTEQLPEGPGTQAARELGFGDRLESLVVPPSPPADTKPDGPEVVFFGRLETRKGLETFCDALDLLARDPEPPRFDVCFLGSETPIRGIPARAYVKERIRGWPWSCRVRTDLNQLEAVAYIRAAERLAVMPSPVDNSPNTVLEALGLGIPFITSRGGGIPELIHPLDLGSATFAQGQDAEPLANAIRAAMSRGDAIRPRFAVDPRANQEVHVEWHERVAANGPIAPVDRAAAVPRPRVSVCLEAGDEPHLLERARLAFERQDLDEVERVVAVPAGEPTRLQEAGWRVVAGQAGALDAAAAAAATGDWIFLCDCAYTPQPDLLSTLVTAGELTGADVVTGAVTYPSPTDGIGRPWRGNVPLGGAAAIGLHYDCFGLGGALVRREAYDRLGGFDVDGPPAVRRRDLLSRAALAGLRFEVVPEPLAEYDTERAERRALPPNENLLRAMRPYEQALPETLTDLPALAVSGGRGEPDSAAKGEREAYLRDLEERLHVMTTSKSWRATSFLRSAMRALRGSDG